MELHTAVHCTITIGREHLFKNVGTAVVPSCVMLD